MKAHLEDHESRRHEAEGPEFESVEGQGRLVDFPSRGHSSRALEAERLPPGGQVDPDEVVLVQATWAGIVLGGR